MRSSILIVEDEWLIADSLQGDLESMGYQVVGIASSGEDAMAKAAEHKPDLILMDIVLKGKMDGVQTAVAIRDCCQIPVIYLTAYVDDQTLTRARETGSFGYLVKPVESYQLRPMIEMALAKHQLEKERETLLARLQTAQAHIKALQGTLPICASCKNIRDDDGYWQRVETYIQEHSEADFTHGICPDCLVKLYPELYQSKQ